MVFLPVTQLLTTALEITPSAETNSEFIPLEINLDGRWWNCPFPFDGILGLKFKEASLPKNDPPYPGTYDNLHIRWEFIINRLKKGPPFPPTRRSNGSDNSWPGENRGHFHWNLWMGTRKCHWSRSSCLCGLDPPDSFQKKAGKDVFVAFGGRKKLQPKHGGVGWCLFRKASFFEGKRQKKWDFLFLGGRSFTWRYLGNHSTREFLNETFWNPLLAVGSWWWSKSRPRGDFLAKVRKRWRN